MRVSEGINLKFVLTKKLVFFFKHRASEIRVKRIRVNRGVGVYENAHKRRNSTTAVKIARAFAY